MYMDYDHRSPVIEGQGQRSRSTLTPNPNPTANPSLNPNVVGLTSILNQGQFLVGYTTTLVPFL